MRDWNYGLLLGVPGKVSSVAYLWGIEIKHYLKDMWIRKQSVAYLWGIEMVIVQAEY